MNSSVFSPRLLAVSAVLAGVLSVGFLSTTAEAVTPPAVAMAISPKVCMSYHIGANQA